MPGLLGAIVGGFLIITLFALLWEFLLFKRVFDDPLIGKVCSVVAATITVCTIAGFGFASGGRFAWWAIGQYSIPAGLVGLWFYHRGSRLREEREERAWAAPVDPTLERTFE